MREGGGCNGGGHALVGRCGVSLFIYNTKLTNNPYDAYMTKKKINCNVRRHRSADDR